MNREKLLGQIINVIDQSPLEQHIEDVIADFILANFTPKGEAEKVTAARIYEIMIGSSNWDDYHFYFLAEQAHEAARAFNEYKTQDND